MKNEDHRYRYIIRFHSPRARDRFLGAASLSQLWGSPEDCKVEELPAANVAVCSAPESQRERFERELESSDFVVYYTGVPPESQRSRDIPNTREVFHFFHCERCIAEKPGDISPRDWARLEVGLTPIGIQVWCLRHNANVAHIDFENQTHPVNSTVATETPEAA